MFTILRIVMAFIIGVVLSLYGIHVDQIKFWVLAGLISVYCTISYFEGKEDN